MRMASCWGYLLNIINARNEWLLIAGQSPLGNFYGWINDQESSGIFTKVYL